MLYPKTKLKAGIYEVSDEMQNQVIFSIDDHQKIKVLEDEQNVLFQDGEYQLQFKKFLGTKK